MAESTPQYNNDGNHTDSSNYGYTPSAGWCLAFIVIFSVTAAVHSAQAYRSKYWIIYPTLVLGALTEVLGWSGRYWSSQNVLLLTPFLLQICTLIMAPVFFSAYDYVVLGMAIKRLGPEYSILRPNLYFAIFIVADLVSLILQAIGGGQAASSAATSSPTKTATNIMVAGIIFQLISMGVFIILGLDFMIRATSRSPYLFRQRQIANRALKKAEKAKSKSIKQGEKGEGELNAVRSEETMTDPAVVTRPKDTAVEADVEAQEHEMERENLRNWWILLVGVGISSLMILIRGIYRSIELVQGWSGFLITHQMYQNTLDGIPMVIAVVVYNFIHPMFLLPKKGSWKGYH